MFGANKSSNLSPNGIPAGQWMNQTIGYFFICFSLKCSYNLEPKLSSKILQSYENYISQTWVKSTHCERQLAHNSLTPKIWLLIRPLAATHFLVNYSYKNLVLDQDHSFYLISLNNLITCLLNNLWYYRKKFHINHFWGLKG